MVFSYSNLLNDELQSLALTGDTEAYAELGRRASDLIDQAEDDYVDEDELREEMEEAIQQEIMEALDRSSASAERKEWCRKLIRNAIKGDAT